MLCHLKTALALLLVTTGLTLASARADTLIKKDGQAIDVKKAREEGDAYRLWFSAGEIVVPKTHVASVEIEGDMSEYVPKDDKEKAFLAQGYVKHRGSWMSKAGYTVELEKAADVRRKRTAELAARSKWDKGWEVESKHFRFKSNTSPEILQHYVDMIEAYYDLMDSRIGIKLSPIMARTKMRVNVFKRQQEMIDDANDDFVNENLLGYFSSSEQTLNFFHDYKDPARSELTALHECTHLLTHLIDPNYWAQIWINEAVADYFGACTLSVVKGKVQLTPGRIDEDSILTVQEAIKAKKTLPLQKLFTTEQESYDGFYYAHGWSLVYFFQNSPKYQKPFNKFFKDLYALELKDAQIEVVDTGSDDKSGMRRKYAASEIVASMLKRLAIKDVATLEKEWLAYVAAVPNEGARARFLRGYGSAFEPERAKEALVDLNAAIESGYRNPEAYWARGYAHIFTDNGPNALADFQQAIQLSPLEGVYRADLAWCLTGWWGAESKEIDGSDEDKAEAQKQFGLAAEIDPENEELVSLFAEFLATRK